MNFSLTMWAIHFPTWRFDNSWKGQNVVHVLSSMSDIIGGSYAVMLSPVCVWICPWLLTSMFSSRFEQPVQVTAVASQGEPSGLG
jgi:hypothetical protein